MACGMSSKPTPEGDRVAKVIARAGVASRREAERMIEEGRVSVNGQVIDRAALNVTDRDRVEVDGKALDAPEAARIWLYHKPVGLVTTTKDEQGRPTIFDDLPDDLPRVMSVGRLDLNSEGLLLLTNDGAVKRKLELPSTGWLRRYRVRVNGRPTDAMLAPLREGLTVDGQTFQPMTVAIDRQQGANAWLTVGLREGKNREIRRAMTDIGLTVNRLIRLSYGPFQLGQLKPGEVQEVRGRIVRDQLGMPAPSQDSTGEAKAGGRGKPAGRGAPGKPTMRGNQSKPASRGGLGKPATRGEQGKPPTRGEQGKPATRGGPGKPATRGGEGKPGPSKPRNVTRKRR